MAKAKGIRVNQLAKELGIPSKLILDKCKAEGLGEKVPNHMSLMSLGLAETVREWFAGGAGGIATAVETATEEAAAAETATATEVKEPKPVKPRPLRPRKKKVETPAAEVPVEGSAVAAPVEEEPAAAPEKAAEIVAPEVPTAEPTTPPPSAPEIPAQPAIAGPPPAAPEVPAAPPIAPSPIVPQTPSAPPAEGGGGIAAAATATPIAPAAAPREPRQARPTITLANRPSRQPVTPAPKLMAPAPAKMQGPRVVREEQPDHVPTPRKRTPMEPASGPTFVQARTQGGRGVKTSEDEDEDGKKKAKSGRTLSSRRRGPDGRRGEALEKLREWTEADLIERRDRLNAAAAFRAGFEGDLKKKSERGQHPLAKTALEKGEPVVIDEPVTIRSLSAELGIKTNELMTKLMRQGVMANINQSLDRDAAAALALEYGIELRFREEQTLEEQLEQEVTQRPVDASKLVPRPPVVTILGHVDHGKTSLLDKIRKSNVAAGEAGGITQHTAAWMVEIQGSDGQKKRVTFIDTPGHQAFTAMRARGANMTDVVVLVVSAAEGVQPQTIESINHARAAKVPIVVAMNKIDRADADPNKILGQLAKEGLNAVEYGGETEVVRTSATTGQGIPELIETLDYQAALLELKADPTAPARGMVIESRVDEGLGPVATVLVQDGTLRVGDILLTGSSFGRIRSLVNDRGEMIQEAGPATPVIVSGLNSMPGAGDKFFVVDDMERVREIAEERETQTRQSQLASQNRVSADSLLSTMKSAEAKIIHLIIKADVQGSVETLVNSVGGQNTEEVKVRVVHAGVGAISESDVQLAMATRINPDDPTEPNKVAIIGFNVVPDDTARMLAEQNHIDVKTYRVIYEIFDDLKKALSGMLAPEEREKLHGHAEIRQVFKVSRVGNIAGCMVLDGHIQRGSKFRLIRDGVVVTENLSLDSLKRMKDDVKEVKAGFECGLKLAGYDDIKVGDRLEAYSREIVQRTL